MIISTTGGASIEIAVRTRTRTHNTAFMAPFLALPSIPYPVPGNNILWPGQQRLRCKVNISMLTQFCPLSPDPLSTRLDWRQLALCVPSRLLDCCPVPVPVPGPMSLRPGKLFGLSGHPAACPCA